MTLEKLRSLFRASLALPPEAHVDSVAYGQNEEWDSVAHMNLVSHIERDFEVLLETEEVVRLTSFAEARRLLEARGIAFES
jgi:acyl carrier protein